jgi:hypothetical protein
MILYIKQIGSTITHHGKILRTPVKIRINESDVNKFTKMLRNKSILDYELIAESSPMVTQNIHKVKIIKAAKPIEQVKNNILSDKICQPVELLCDDDKTKTSKARVVRCVRKEDFEKINEAENIHSESFEDAICSDIEIDMDGDDILKQLLSNI